MGLFERTVSCEGCGKKFSAVPGLSIGRIRRCSSCPPAPETSEAPALMEQLWDLIRTILDCERRERLQDRLDQMR
jgi:hypothetical protein